jgi:hypothetical protein
MFIFASMWGGSISRSLWRDLSAGAIALPEWDEGILRLACGGNRRDLAVHNPLLNLTAYKFSILRSS